MPVPEQGGLGSGDGEVPDGVDATGAVVGHLAGHDAGHRPGEQVLVGVGAAGGAVLRDDQPAVGLGLGEGRRLQEALGQAHDLENGREGSETIAVQTDRGKIYAVQTDRGKKNAVQTDEGKKDLLCRLTKDFFCCAY